MSRTTAGWMTGRCRAAVPPGAPTPSLLGLVAGGFGGGGGGGGGRALSYQIKYPLPCGAKIVNTNISGRSAPSRAKKRGLSTFELRPYNRGNNRVCLCFIL